MVHPVFIQTFFYSIVSIFIIVGVSLLLKGFFWKYVKVRVSFGKLLLVKIRTTLRDYYALGRVKDGFLIYKVDKKVRRIAISPDTNCIYRCLGINWVDLDEEKSALCKVDYKPITGWDSEKFNNLLIRSLTQPPLNNNKEKIILVCIIGIGLLMVGSLYLGYISYQNSQVIIANQEAIFKLLDNAGKVVGSNKVI